MTRSHINRRAATVLTAAVALGAAGPAAARPVGDNGPVPVEPPAAASLHANATAAAAAPHMKGFPETTAAPIATATPRAVINHSAPAGSSDLVYIVVGGVLVALSGVGIGAGLAATSRRRTATPRARIAA